MAVLTSGTDLTLSLTGPDRSGADTHGRDRKSTRLNSSHANISYAVFCLKKKKNKSFGYHLTTEYYSWRSKRHTPTSMSPNSRVMHVILGVHLIRKHFI